MTRRDDAPGGPAPGGSPPRGEPGNRPQGSPPPFGRAQVPPNAAQRPRPPEPPSAPRASRVPGPPPPQVAPRKRRPGLLVLGVLVLVLAVAAGAVALIRPEPVRRLFGSNPVPAASEAAGLTGDPPPGEVLPPASADAPMPTPAGVARAVDPQIKGGLGSHFGISVMDVATGQTLYGNNANVPVTPASTTKLATAAAVLASVDPSRRLPTRAVAGDRAGEVVLIGGGDPTLSAGREQAYPGAARLDQLADQVTKALGGAHPTSVVVDSTLFTGPVYGPGWDSDTPGGGFASATVALATDGARTDPRSGSGGTRYPKPDLAAGQAFGRLLGVAPSAVRLGKAPAGTAPAEAAAPAGAASGASGGVAPSANGSPENAPVPPDGAGRPPAPGTELGRVESPPMLRLVEWMLSMSDNVIAEALARQVAIARGQPASYDGASAAIRDTLAGLGLPAGELSAADGSGLSRSNHFTAEGLAKLLAVAANGSQPKLQPIFSGLPVAAWSGTLANRYRGADSGKAGAGLVRAKTGTLTKVNAIAGVVVDADGRLLSFSMLADKVPNGWLAPITMDRIAAELSRCGCH
ncbi:D-alanyl-D-alanine carboxypeptidase/D-alanyl-D-alanine endopeptidase [Rhizomonospora bruguierae]|uniref:D-alanyl-D-alanine carboxypeptidase/D-alanyl-D-alanine endopeptidase n=1 Tax=Rhizomonospora bruguierae TaxID=1581705 RepID=UPI0020C06470|nr:D-alanyl-D-alanine carboxypeptidase/D-alanyl-D-alanine-endopeptidase [Micromonospora sp. NBRC 107566]